MNPLARALLTRRDDLAALYLIAGALMAIRRERSAVVPAKRRPARHEVPEPPSGRRKAERPIDRPTDNQEVDA